MVTDLRIGLATGTTSDIAGLARRTESAGFDLLAAGEHLLFHGPTPNSLIYLAAAAGATSKLGLVSSITLAPLYPPVLLAKLTSVLHEVSNGRFELGLGAGGEYPAEFAAVGVDVADRFKLLDEAIGLIKRLTNGHTVTDSETTWQLTEANLDPAPTKPIPMWLAGRRGRPLDRVAKHADIWLPYMVTPDGIREGIEHIEDHRTRNERSTSVDAALLLWTCVDQDGAWAQVHGTDFVSKTYAQDFAPLADRYLAVGDVESVCERIQSFIDAGVRHLLLQIAAGPDHVEKVRETLASEVLPRLRRANPPDGDHRAIASPIETRIA